MFKNTRQAMIAIVAIAVIMFGVGYTIGTRGKESMSPQELAQAIVKEMEALNKANMKKALGTWVEPTTGKEF